MVSLSLKLKGFHRSTSELVAPTDGTARFNLNLNFN